MVLGNFTKNESERNLRGLKPLPELLNFIRIWGFAAGLGLSQTSQASHLAPPLPSACSQQLTGTAVLGGEIEIGPPMDTRQVWRDLSQQAELIYEMSPDRENKGFKVFWARGDKIPTALQEIGRLREITFRQVGEGSGQAYDNDKFDPHYWHLVAWDKSKERIAGAYRLGVIKELVADQSSPLPYSLENVYTAQLFDFQSLLSEEFIGGALEFGRSFVLPEYQRRSLALAALWQGIGSILVSNPEFKYLIGPVSISGEFNPQSISIMLEFFKQHFSHPWAEYVKSYTPYSPPKPLKSKTLQEINETAGSFQALKQLVQDSEGNPEKTPPPLLKIYADIGAKMLAQNHDQSFNSIDIMILVPLSEQSHEVLRAYLGDEGATNYLNFHSSMGGTQPPTEKD